MRLTKFVSYFLLILLLGGVLLVADDAALAYSGRLCRGLVIAGVPVGGLLAGEAEKKVESALRDQLTKPVATLHFEGKKWEIGWDAVAGRPDAPGLVRQAYSVGRTGNLMQRLRAEFVAKNGGSIVLLGMNADMEKIRAVVTAAAISVDREAVDATLAESTAGLLISEDRSGRRTEIEDTVRVLAGSIATGLLAAVPLSVTEMPAAIRSKDLQGIDGLVSAFSTMYDASADNRSHNIKIAAERLSGALVRSGEVFSFNGRVGLRTQERGYRTAPTLSSAGTVMDWGGGVCQVSSTFYNAALLADFSVEERSAHYQPPVYVPLGQDATVADGQIDLKMKNMRNHAVYFQSVADAGKLEVRVYGKQEKEAPAIRLELTEKTVQAPKTVILQDPTLPLGEERVESAGRIGFAVTVHRVRLQGTKEISREKISEDDFEAEDRVVRVGTRSAPGTVVK